LVQRTLEAQGYDVILAADGQQGLDLANQLNPDLMICDWMMPTIDGLEVCRQVRANPHLTTTFFILLTARSEIVDRVTGLDAGADDFITKPIEMNELKARVRAGLRLHQLNQDLQTQKQHLEAELAEAAAYVRALLPLPLQGSVQIQSRFIPCSQLGGDCFDYFWLDPDYLVMYLLDVSGHGLGAALPSSLVLNLLRSRSLPTVNFYQPHDVLQGLNEAFQMSHQNQKYLTIWYGVYNLSKRQLTYASAGHPPAILIHRSEASSEVGSEVSSEVKSLTVERLRTPNVPIGILSDTVYVSDRTVIPPQSTLYIFSDGIYDVNPIGQSLNWGLEKFIKLLVNLDLRVDLDTVLEQVQKASEISAFSDDLSLLQAYFE
ncbi:MAG TPA: SpoIIE family protein phosphatase, partial [Allocoleopsis sp.]